MFSENRLSKGPASQLANAIHTFRENESDDFFALETVIYRDGSEIPQEKLWARLMKEDELRGRVAITTLADESEIAHCITDTGRHVDIMLGTPEARSAQPAMIILEEEK